MSYWVAVVARNAAPNLRRTLDSLLHQTLKPRRLIVVNDGSTDETAKILQEYRNRTSRITVLTLPDRGYDIRRVPVNINLASKTAEAKFSTDFFMISGDDCTYPKEYAETLIRRMNAEPRIAVASGRPSSGGVSSQEHVPSGSGRMINCTYWREIRGRYPVRAGWETWLLYKAEQKGFKVRLFNELVFDHAHPRGAKHQFLYWGAAMQTLGYDPLYAMGRITKNTFRPTIAPKRAMNMLRGYLQAKLGSEDTFLTPFEPSLRSFARQQQAYRIASVVASLGSRR